MNDQLTSRTRLAQQRFYCLVVLFTSLILLFSQYAASQTAQSGHSCTVHFLNGDVLKGTSLSATSSTITIGSALLSEPATFQTIQIKNIELHLPTLPTSDQPAEHLAKITTRTGHPKNKLRPFSETLAGQLIGIDKNSITLKSNFTSDITIPRSQIQKIEITDQSGIVYQNPNDIANWQSRPSEASSWQIRHHKFISTKETGEISRDIKLPDLAHISFELEHTSTRRFYLYLYASANPDDDEEKRNYYQFVAQTGNHFIQRVTDGVIYPISRKVNRNAFSRHKHSSKTISYDLYLDLSRGKFHIFLNGNFYRTFSDDKVPAGKLGTALHLVSKSSPHTVKNFKIRKWNGALSLTDSPFRDEPLAPNEMRLNNGDTVTGVASSIKDNAVLVETKYGTLPIPLKGVQQIHTPSVKAPIELTLTPSHIKATFPDQQFIILSITSISGYQLKATHSIFGERVFDLRAFSKLEFDL